ncbi:MAG: sulfurtransferase [Ignavibacteriaceae bacterium]|nr:sulfurtransferase [Ignavibacteriaceae bacterium]
MIKNYRPSQVKEILENSTDYRLIDVRERWEHEICRLPDSELMPLSEFHTHIKNIKPDEKIIFYCHHGSRSLNVCMYLAGNGYSNVINLLGGIDAWSDEVDNTLPKY